MPRTPLASKLGEAASIVSEAVERGVSTDQVIEERAGLSRRELLAGGAAIAVAGALSTRVPRALAATPQKIVIIGAGLAGLTCAYDLRQAGVSPPLYHPHA